MENEQILKRLEWLDEERRKDKTLIATLEDRVQSLEENNIDLAKENKNLISEISHLSVMLTRIDRLEGSLANVQVDLNRKLDAEERSRVDQGRDAERTRRADLESLNKLIAEVRNNLTPIPDLQKSLKLRIEEEFRLSKLIEEVKTTVKEEIQSDEDSKRTIKLLEEGRRQDAKRITDLQAEVSALRKRSDEHRGKVDLLSDGVNKQDVRINDLQTADQERRQNQASFIERQNMQMVDRERVWKEWEVRFEEINQQAARMEAELQTLDSTNRTLKRSQKSFEEVTENFNRRVNEITEMQRLVEERFRQEWSVFKADEQKRWTNFSMTQDELQQESDREIKKLKERLIVLEDLGQELKDNIYHLVQSMQNQLQRFQSLSLELFEENERTLGQG